ncbi:hypothetical protein PHYSODRAFT_509636, partial [Phytophthora sojae]
TRLTSKRVLWTWAAEHKATFGKLKVSRHRSTLFPYPDYDSRSRSLRWIELFAWWKQCRRWANR